MPSTRGSRAAILGGPLLALAAAASLGGEAARAPLLENGDTSRWSTRSFEGRTRYEPARKAGRSALRARSEGSASAIYRRVDVDLSETPILSWSWRVEAANAIEDERTRAGDDFPARVIVAARSPESGDLRALAYVWARHEPEGATWPNPHAAETVMVVARSGLGGEPAWRRERRRVREDFLRHHGFAPEEIDLVAIMADTDDAGGRSCSYLDDLAFSARSLSPQS